MIKQRHKRSIQRFREWLIENPSADLERQIITFDSMVDKEYRKFKKEKQNAKKITKKVVHE